MGCCNSKQKDDEYFDRRMSHILRTNEKSDNIEELAAKQTTGDVQVVVDSETGVYDNMNEWDGDDDEQKEEEQEIEDPQIFCEMLQKWSEADKQVIKDFFYPGSQITAGQIGRQVRVKLPDPNDNTKMCEYTGVLRYVAPGPPQNLEREVGVALDEPFGDHNGTDKNKRAFKCRPKHGIYTTVKHIKLIKTSQHFREMVTKRCAEFPDDICEQVVSGPMIYYKHQGDGQSYGTKNWAQKHLDFCCPSLNNDLFIILDYCPHETVVIKSRHPSKIRYDKKLGEGSFGTVWSGSVAVPEIISKEMTREGIPSSGPWNGGLEGEFGLPCAIKLMKKSVSEEDVLLFAQEAVVMNQFEHDNIVFMYYVAGGKRFGGGPLALTMEYCEGGDVLHHLREGNLTWQDILRAMCDVANAMLYLSYIGFVHRDLASRNLLITRGLTKVGDFGLSRVLESSFYLQKKEGVPLPIRWTAPEAYLYHEWGWQSDVWSYGILIYEFFTAGALPYYGLSNVGVIENIIKTESILPPPPKSPPCIYGLMTRCWNVDPKKRPDFSEILSELVMKCANKNFVIPNKPSSLTEYESWGNQYVDEESDSVIGVGKLDVKAILESNPYFSVDQISKNVFRSRSVKRSTKTREETNNHLYMVNGHEYYIPDGSEAIIQDNLKESIQRENNSQKQLQQIDTKQAEKYIPESRTVRVGHQFIKISEV
eukprot:m.68544 g.68544  ORF g.68544 m.68544 type:complete len:704 (-) comp11977_c0_seq1:2784-4895(-)